MKKILISVLAAAALLSGAPLPKKPKLVVAIAVDQFRYDYLTRFRSEYTAGLNRLLTQGAVWTNARYEHFPTVTAVGHATFLTGATPSLSGIAGNEWYDREAGKTVTSVSDDDTVILGGRGGKGSSPRRLLVSTVGDELKTVSARSRIIGISLKDRAAILPAGHMADGAYWFDNRSGSFVSSSFYFARVPAWVEEFNGKRPGDRYAGVKWLDHTMPSEPAKVYEELAPSPFGNELIEAFAERAVRAEQLGRRDAIDLLTVSFSSNDYLGHRYGPDSPEAHEVSVRTDKLLGKFFQFLDAEVGMANVLVVLTADHGVAPVPEVAAARKMPGGRVSTGVIRDAMLKALNEKFGAGEWIVSAGEQSVYLNRKLLAERKLDGAEVNRVAARAALDVPHVFRAYTREDLSAPGALEDQVARRVQNGYNVRRGGDVTVLLEPYWLLGGKSGTSHGTTFSYDAHVPVIFMGPGIKPGRYHRTVAPNDIAPTLATLLDLETPSGSVGRVLAEMLAQ